MRPQLSQLSTARLSTAHAKLIGVFTEVARRVPTVIFWGHRAKVDQDKAVAEKRSSKPFPTSKHNFWPSLAVDAGPDMGPVIDWKNEAAFVAFAKTVLEVAKELGVEIRWGGDWDRDGVAQERGEWDLVHFELVLKAS